MDSKSDLRRIAKIKRKELDITTISSKICKNIRNLEIYKSANNIMIFYPLKYEISLLELTKDKNKNFYLPKVYNDDLLVCPYTTELKKSSLNIQEPCSEPISPKDIDIVFVPALLVDKNNYRLGYGGGFYDRFLFQNNHITSITPIAKNLIVDDLPHDIWDIKINYIISEN